MSGPPPFEVPPGRAVPFGDRGLVVGTHDAEAARALSASLSHLAGVLEICPGSRTVVVLLDDPLTGQFLDRVMDLADGPARPQPDPREVVIPVVFDGTDLDAVARETGMNASETVSLLCASWLTVAFVGFAPGFPYLTGLPEQLARIPRRAVPRTSVPAGAVAIGGGSAGIYPTTSPGGWNVLGTTDFVLFDPDSPPYAALRPGDRVRFARSSPGASSDRQEKWPRRPRGHLTTTSSRSLEVVAPGTQVTVQGAARRGFADLGVPAAGPADATTMLLANRLVGNRDDAGALETAASGPTLRVHGTGHVALVGSSSGAASWTLDGRDVPSDTVVEVSSGQLIRIAVPRSGLRAYLAVGGGVETPMTLGSVSSDLLSGLGPGPLHQGDFLGIGSPGRPRGRLEHRSAVPALRPLRAIAGPHDLGAATLRALCGRTWTVSTDSSRVGLRLESDGEAVSGGEIGSLGMVTGAIQIPPGGHPVLLGVDHGTLGGYPVVASVISADLDRLGQLAPGDPIRFSIVDLDEARISSDLRLRSIDAAVAGWFPTRTAT